MRNALVLGITALTMLGIVGCGGLQAKPQEATGKPDAAEKVGEEIIVKPVEAEFPLTGVIRGWTIGLGQMVEGEKRRLWIPEKLAYRGQEGKPQGMLVFDVELIEIK